MILGGGMSSLTTALTLTDQEGWQERYEITLYQMGWRLGGKGASGRNMEGQYARRIEEHGIHVFWGFYNNAFRVMQTCYRELGRPPDAPLATSEEAFKPHNVGVLEEKLGGRWQHWPIETPINEAEPGTSAVFHSLTDYIGQVLSLSFDVFRDSPWATTQGEPTPRAWMNRLIEELAPGSEGRLNSCGRLFQAARELARMIAPGASASRKADTAPGVARSLASRLAGFSGGPLAADQLEGLSELRELGLKLGTEATRGALRLLERALRFILTWLWSRIADSVDDDFDAHRLWVTLNFAYGNLHGAIHDRLFTRGLDAINDHDYAEWLDRFVIPDGGRTASSALVRWLYDACFAYVDGDVQRPSLEAGTALKAHIRLFLTYKGALYYKFQAGMGDVVFAPLYLVLKRRGVRFEFFHQVRNLGLSEDRRTVATVEIRHQARVKPEIESAGGYDPLVDVKGLPCWPSTPLYEQLVEGEELAARKIRLESMDNHWPGAGSVTLHAGEDFDELVLGISIGGLPSVCRELIDANGKWSKMVRHLRTVRTQAFQLWLEPSLPELGWTTHPPMMTSYDLWIDSRASEMPMNSWVDMTHTMKRERWPQDGRGRPRSVSYFCSPLPDLPDHGEPESVESLGDRARSTALAFLENHFWHLLPDATSPPGVEGAPFDWELLVDRRSPPGEGRERFDSQFWTETDNPSDRYVLSVANSSQHRLRAGESGFDNLYLTGDWIDNTFNLGCIESAVMSGLATSNAMTGHPRLAEISGWGLGAAVGTTGSEAPNRRIIDYYEGTELDYKSILALDRHQGIHFGYHEVDDESCPIDSDSTAEAILRMNSVMAHKASIRPGMRVLDAGCGIGGSSVWLASKIGAEVTGITLVEKQRDAASDLAQRRAVSDKTRFLVRDYLETGFPDASFDVVWGLESICYAEDKRRFLREAKRVLKPGGTIIVADGFKTRHDYSAEEQLIMDAWLSGWAVSDLDTPEEFGASLEAVGFAEINRTDITRNVLPFSRWLCRRAILASPLAGLLHRLNVVRRVQIDNAISAIEQYRGLHSGLWRYVIFRAR